MKFKDIITIAISCTAIAVSAATAYLTLRERVEVSAALTGPTVFYISLESADRISGYAGFEAPLALINSGNSPVVITGMKFLVYEVSGSAKVRSKCASEATPSEPYIAIRAASGELFPVVINTSEVRLIAPEFQGSISPSTMIFPTGDRFDLPGRPVRLLACLTVSYFSPGEEVKVANWAIG